jgi:hypothetical protein
VADALFAGGTDLSMGVIFLSSGISLGISWAIITCISINKVKYYNKQLEKLYNLSFNLNYNSNYKGLSISYRF